MAYDASVKFNSKIAENRVDALSRRIGNLRTRLKETSTSLSRVGRETKDATTNFRRSADAAKRMTTDITRLGAAVRKTRTDIVALNRSMNGRGFQNAANSLSGLARNFGSVSGAMTRMRSASSVVNKNLTSFTPKAQKAGTASIRLARALQMISTGASRADKSLSGMGVPLTRLGGAHARAATSARSHAKATERASSASLGYSRRAAKSMVASGRLSRSVQNADRSFLGLAASMVRVRNLGLFLASGFGVQGVIEMADTYKLVRARLEIVTDSVEELSTRQAQLNRISNVTRTAYKDNAALFVKLAQAGEAYGVSQAKSLTVTENVAKAMKISGASTSEARAATQQLAQAFASGRIQGDELRSVLENSPRIAKALSTELSHLGVNLGNIRDMASEGKIGINELVTALGGANITKELAEEFERIPLTVGDAITVAKNKIMDSIGRFDEATGATDKLSRAIVYLADNIDTLGRALAVLAGAKMVQWVASMSSASRIMPILARGLGGSSMAMAALGGHTLKTLGAFLRFAGPVGVVITALELLYNRSNEGADRISQLSDEMGEGSNMAGMYHDQATRAMNAQGNLTNAQEAGVKGSDKLKGATQELSDKIRELGLVSQWTAYQVTKAFQAEKFVSMSKAQSEMAKAKGNRRNDPFLSQTASGQGFEDDYSFARSAYMRELNEYKTAAKATQLARKAFTDAFNMPSAPATVSGSGSQNKKDKKSGADKAAKEIENLKDAIRNMEAEYSDAENARQEFNEGLLTLDKSLSSGVITQERYNRLLSSLASDVFPGLKDEISDLRKENESLNWSLNGDDESVIRFKEGTRELREQIGHIDTIIATEGDRTGALREQRDVLSRQVDEYGQLIEENRYLVQLGEERKEQERQITRLIDEASDNLYEMLTSRVSDALSFSTNSFKNFFKSLLGMAKDTLSSILGAYVFEPMRQSFRAELEKAFKISEKTSKKSGSDFSKPWSQVYEEENGSVGTTNENVIVVEGKMPAGFWQQFAKGYKDSWRDVAGDLKTLFKPLADTFKGLFDKLGVDLGGMGEVLGKAFGGAQVGAQVAGIGKMLGIKTSTTGGSIGGAIGAVSGIPGGQLIGSIAGSILGGLFKKAKYGTTVVTGGSEGDISTSGNSSERREGSIGAAGDVQSYLNQIADQLGGTVGAFRVSIGQYKDRWKVSTSGRSGKLKNKYGDVVDFKDDQAGAIAFAIETAVKQGAIKGLRAATQRLLQSSGDIEQGLQDALDFENVFTRLKEKTDPIGYAMENLGKEFERLSDLFRKAGATSEEWAQLGELFRMEIEETTKAQIDSLIAFRDDLIGGDRSYKSPTDRLKIADERFRSMEAKIRAGEFVDQNEFTEAGQALQEIARQVYGSTPEFQAYQQRLLDATNKLIDNAEAEADSLQPVVDAIANQTKVNQNGNDKLDQLINIMGSGYYGGGGGGGSGVGGGRDILGRVHHF